MGFLPRVLAATVALVAVIVAQKWDFRENFFFNISALLKPYIMPFDSVVGYPRETQLKILQKGRKAWEDSVASATADSSEAMFQYFYGKVFADAIFGPKATRVASFSVQSSSDPENPSIPVTCTCPHDAGPHSNLPMLLFFHSGGMITGSVQSELHLARFIASRANIVACSIGYRLAPEHRYPAAVEDAMDAAAALLRPESKMDNPAAKALDVGLDVSTFVTWGTSAGGYMSAHVARHLAHYHNKTAALQVSLVPMAKPHGGTKSLVENWFDPFWSAALNAYAWSVYLEGDNGSLSTDWRVSLLMNPPKDTIARLPPTYVQINTRDGLHDEGEMYADVLRKQGKLFRLDEFDVTHVGGIPPFDTGTPGEGAYDRAISVLISHLAQAAPLQTPL